MIARLLLLLVCLCISLSANETKHLKINIFCADRSGLTKDRVILGEALQGLNCAVTLHPVDGHIHAPEADINIFIETLCPDHLDKSQLNWFIPNPEWDWNQNSKELLKSIDLILCRTHEVERIFTELNKATFFLGFSSPDHYDAKISKNYAHSLHLPGTSRQKGTRPILNAWTENPDFPHLTVVKNSDLGCKVPLNVSWNNEWVSSERLRHLQNSCGIHLCLSETEGFGHYLMEAMSVGAVVVTTDAPPMNEFIVDSRCLVPYTCWRFQNLGTNYYVDSNGIEKTIKSLMKLSTRQLEEIGKKNRKRYLQIKKQFKQNLKKLLETKV